MVYFCINIMQCQPVIVKWGGQVEEHMVDGKMKQLLVHRKGSTRAFPPHHPLIPVDYQLTGQPVLIGGTMGTNSYVLTGAPPSPSLATLKLFQTALHVQHADLLCILADKPVRDDTGCSFGIAAWFHTC